MRADERSRDLLRREELTRDWKRKDEKRRAENMRLYKSVGKTLQRSFQGQILHWNCWREGVAAAVNPSPPFLQNVDSPWHFACEYHIIIYIYIYVYIYI